MTRLSPGTVKSRNGKIIKNLTRGPTIKTGEKVIEGVTVASVQRFRLRVTRGEDNPLKTTVGQWESCWKGPRTGETRTTTEGQGEEGGHQI